MCSEARSLRFVVGLQDRGDPVHLLLRLVQDVAPLQTPALLWMEIVRLEEASKSLQEYLVRVVQLERLETDQR